MDNPSFQDDTAASRKVSAATPERPPAVKKPEITEKPIQRKSSYSYQPRSRSNRDFSIFLTNDDINFFPILCVVLSEKGQHSVKKYLLK